MLSKPKTLANIQLTQELVKSLFDYKDGKLYWKIALNRSIIVGSEAGHINKGKKPRYYVKFYGVNYASARIIYLLHHGWLPVIVDHEDRNQLNDNIDNLRPANRKQNNSNRKAWDNASSKYLGVHFRKQSKVRKWAAQISVNRKHTFLGIFLTEEEAARCYNEAAQKYHGEFANLNIIE
jgi:hypothetical protein